jgi:hypothetical protein
VGDELALQVGQQVHPLIAWQSKFAMVDFMSHDLS